MSKSQTMPPNPAHALDAAMSFSLHFEGRDRGASDVRRYCPLRARRGQ